MKAFSSLPTLAETQAQPRACQKPETRLEQKVKAKKLTVVDDRVFKKEVWTRDKWLCRCCGRKVIKTLALVPERGEVHHIHGRVGDLRFESRAALLLCKWDHERVTGKVNDKLVILPTRTFRLRDETYTDARFKVTFEKVA